MRRTRSRAALKATIPSMRSRWPIPSAWRCWWCWRRWRRPSAWRSCCTTCSTCRSTRSRRSSGARRPRQGNWPAARGAACRGRRRRRMRTARGKSRSSRPSLPPRAAAISPRCSKCSIRTSCSAPIRPPCSSARQARCAAHRPWPTFSWAARSKREAALIDGAIGAVVAPGGRLLLVLGITVANGKIVGIDAVADPERLARLDLSVFDD